MSTVTSADGTTIAYSRTGRGPALILVDGAMCYRASGPSAKLAEELKEHFTVYTYDRRGRGESGDTAPYAPEREIEDLAALVKETGETPCLFGQSSGAAVALEAAQAGLPIAKLATYEAPFIVDGTRSPVPDDYVRLQEKSLADGRRGEAVKRFMRIVEVPAFVIAMMQLMPAWSKLKAVAHTLPYDSAFVDAYQKGRPLPADRWSAIAVPTLVIDGGKSPAWMRNANKALADVVPGAEHKRLAGQTHLVKPKVLAPALIDFFAS